MFVGMKKRPMNKSARVSVTRFPRTPALMLALLALVSAGRALGPDSPPRFAGMGYLDNGSLQIGVDLSKGGAITYLAPAGGSNLVNSYDLGRQIQMSYYSGLRSLRASRQGAGQDLGGAGLESDSERRLLRPPIPHRPLP